MFIIYFVFRWQILESASEINRNFRIKNQVRPIGPLYQSDRKLYFSSKFINEYIIGYGYGTGALPNSAEKCCFPQTPCVLRDFEA